MACTKDCLNCALSKCKYENPKKSSTKKSEERKEKDRIYHAQRYQKNKEEILQKAREKYAALTPEQLQERKRKSHERYLKNREKIIAKSKAYYAEHKKRA